MIKTILSIALVIVIVIVLSVGANAELVLLKEGQVVSKNDPKAFEIYGKIQDYQWPLLNYTFRDFSEAEQQEIKKTLKEGNFPLVRYVNSFLQKNYPDYVVEYIPNTLFQLVVIVDHMKDLKDDKDIGFSINLQKSIDEVIEFHTQGKCKGKHDFSDTQYLKDFVDSLHSVFPVQQYHKMLNKAYEVMKNDPVNLSQAIENLVNEYLAIKNDLMQKDLKPILGIGWKENGKNFKKILAEAHKDILKKSSQVEVAAEEEGNFLLWRGTGGFEYKDAMGKVIDSANHNVGRLKVEKIKETNQLNEMAGWSDKINNADTDIKQGSLSYGNNVLDGSLQELGEDGARALDYIARSPDKSYYLKISILDFLNLPFEKQNFFISPQCPYSALWFIGELHSRTKVSAEYGKDYKKIKGFAGTKNFSNILIGSPFLSRPTDPVQQMSFVDNFIAQHSFSWNDSILFAEHQGGQKKLSKYQLAQGMFGEEPGAKNYINSNVKMTTTTNVSGSFWREENFPDKSEIESFSEFFDRVLSDKSATKIYMSDKYAKKIYMSDKYIIPIKNYKSWICASVKFPIDIINDFFAKIGSAAQKSKGISYTNKDQFYVTLVPQIEDYVTLESVQEEISRIKRDEKYDADKQKEDQLLYANCALAGKNYKIVAYPSKHGYTVAFINNDKVVNFKDDAFSYQSKKLRTPYKNFDDFCKESSSEEKKFFMQFIDGVSNNSVVTNGFELHPGSDKSDVCYFILSRLSNGK